LNALDELRRGRRKATESKPVLPVDETGAQAEGANQSLAPAKSSQRRFQPLPKNQPQRASLRRNSLLFEQKMMAGMVSRFFAISGLANGLRLCLKTLFPSLDR
jgi:hypothetical protein